jgi:hypothetical protein
MGKKLEGKMTGLREENVRMRVARVEASIFFQSITGGSSLFS